MTRFLVLLCCLCLPAAAPLLGFAQDRQEAHVAKLDPDGVQRVRLEGGGYFFKPGHIVIKVNVPVELLASREAGIVPHDLVIKAPEAGITVEVEFAAEPKAAPKTLAPPVKTAEKAPAEESAQLAPPADGNAVRASECKKYFPSVGEMLPVPCTNDRSSL